MKMKLTGAFIAILFAVVLFCSTARLYTAPKREAIKQTTLIRGTVNPPNGASEVWAVSPTETFKAEIAGGAFELKDIKTGTYTLQVKAIAPYKDATKTAIQVTEGSQIDVGEIKLEQ